MKKSFISFIGVIFILSVSFSATIYSAESGSQTDQGKIAEEERIATLPSDSEELYKKAIALKDDGNYDAASEILKKLVAENPDISKYEISYIDVRLDQAIFLKETQNPDWRSNLKDLGHRLKALYAKNTKNPDYYLIHAKYAWIVEAKRVSHISKAIEKALYYNPGYPEAYILQGDVYFDQARKAGTDDQLDQTSSLSYAPHSTKHTLAYKAKTDYEKALSDAKLNEKRKAYVLYKIGNLEYQIFNNKEMAKINWEKAASLAPDSKAGQLAKQQLSR